MPRPASLRAALAGAALAAAALALPSPAQADFFDGLFVQLYTGLGLTEDSELRVRVPGEGLDLTFSRVVWEDYSLSRPSIPYIGARVGRYFERRPWLGLAVDVIHYKVFAETARPVAVRGTLAGGEIRGSAPLGQFVERYNVGNGVNLYLLTGLARLRRGRDADHPEGRWRPYAGLGIGPTVLYTDATVGGDNRKGYELGELAVQLLAGVELQVGRRISLFAEVKRTRTDANGSVPGGDSETRLDSSHFVVGGGYRF